ncbi:hypothetical protein [Alkalisalibacterium limincola]|uniref:Uncharacterized protein n=1 Tax=Alkalisalibacterium limincola TaxID=2699169 RepID=A0A5C8KR94_9GAMM|nr:hypothetical protein [Alkalisalibacterium limincola]TXK62291.1 hypothetical protein FU658_08625 [Alkalisalibacterium limincola]
MRSLHGFSIVVAATTALVACTPAQVRLPDGFADHASSYEVSGHSPRRFNEPVRFGPYSALEMREGSTFSWAIPVGSVDIGRAARRYAFTLVAPNQSPVEVQCRIRTWAAVHGTHAPLDVDLTALAGPMMACGFWFDGAARVMPLEMSRKGTRLHGRLVSPSGEYLLRSVHGYEGSSWPAAEATGFELLHNGVPLMVVDMLNAGRVHMDQRPDEGERVYLAAAAAALLLLDEELAL